MQTNNVTAQRNSLLLGFTGLTLRPKIILTGHAEKSGANIQVKSNNRAVDCSDICVFDSPTNKENISMVAGTVFGR